MELVVSNKKTFRVSSIGLFFLFLNLFTNWNSYRFFIDDIKGLFLLAARRDLKNVNKYCV